MAEQSFNDKTVKGVLSQEDYEHWGQIIQILSLTLKNKDT